METNNDLLVDDSQKCLFSKMIGINVDPMIAKKIMSFWMFLESKGFENIYENILFADYNFLTCVCTEAEMALAFLESNNLAKPTSPFFCPNTWKLANSFDLSPIDVFEDKEKVTNEILAFQINVCNEAFEDILDRKGKKPIGIEDEEESRTIARRVKEFKLNPLAEPWSPPQILQDDERTLFITFSKSGPLSKTEIINFFRSKYGNCVEEVFIHMPRDKVPEFGKIVFKYSWIPNDILQNKESIIFKIGDKSIGLKKYKTILP